MKNLSDTKIILACTSGGHFATMMGLKAFWSLHDRVWVSDYKKDTKILEKTEKVYWLPYQAPRDIMSLILNLPKIFRILYLENPSLVISTGASIAINFALTAKILGIKFIYIESITRVKD